MFRWLHQRPPCLLATVIVNLKDDSTAFEGALLAVNGPWWTLRNAQLLKAGEPPQPMIGAVIVHRDNVAFTQVP